MKNGLSYSDAQSDDVRGGARSQMGVPFSVFAKCLIAFAPLLFGSAPAFAQELIGSYSAVIGEADRQNSRGMSLSKVSDILTQDRANFHRFGIRQSGDLPDNYFDRRENRADFARLIRNGTVDPDVAHEILHGAQPAITVDIFGYPGRAEYVNVFLSGTERSVHNVASARSSEVLPVDKNDVLFAQQFLAQKGFYSGPLDGDFGPNSLAALEAYRASVGQPGSGPLNSRDLASMRGAPTEAGVAQAAGSATSVPGNLPPETAGSQNSTFPNPATVPTLYGNKVIARDMALWVIAQRPWLSRVPGVYLAFGKSGLPEGYPKFNSAHVSGEIELRQRRLSWLDGVVDQAAQIQWPKRIVVDINASISRRTDESDLQLHLSGYGAIILNMGLQSAGPSTVRTLHIRSPYDSGIVKLTETSPLYLSIPPEIASQEMSEDLRGPLDFNVSVFPDENVFVRFTIDVLEPDIDLPLDREPRLASAVVGDTVATAQMHVVSAELIHQKRTHRKEPRAPEIVAYRWERPAAGLSPVTANMGDVESVAERFGLATDGESLIYSPQIYREKTDFREFPGKLGNAPTDVAADLTLRAAAVFRQFPERPLSEELTVTLAFSALTQVERDTVFPADFQQSPTRGSNTLERRRIVRAAAPKIREIVLANAPALPLSVRSFLPAPLEEYDLSLGGFPLRMASGSFDWLPVPRTPNSVGLRSSLEDVIDFLPMDEESALDFLDRWKLEQQSSPHFWFVLDYEIGAIRVPPVQRSGKITMAELELVDIPIRRKRLTLLEDLTESRVLAEKTFEVQTPVEQGQELPEELYATTAETLLAAFGQFPGGDGIIRESVSFMPAVSRAPETQKPILLEQQVKRIKSLALDQYLVGVQFELEDYDPERGGFPTEGRPYFVSVAHDQDITEQDSVRIITDDLEGYAFIPADREQAEEIASVTRNGDLNALALVKPVGIGEEDRLIVSRPEALLIGPGGSGRIDRVTARIEIPPKPEVSVNSVADIVLPERLYLDPETADLLVLAKAPELYDDSVFDRMFIERLARERDAAKQGDAPPWGFFFNNPGLPMTVETFAELRPSFVSWTRRRVEMLGEEILVSLVSGGDYHPDTSCRTFSQVPPTPGNRHAWQGRALSERYEAILGDEAAQLASSFDEPLTGGTAAIPGPDRVLGMVGRATIPPRRVCDWLGARMPDDIALLGEAVDVESSPYADVVVVMREMPRPGGIDGRLVATDYGIRIRSTRAALPSAAENDGDGFRGALVVEAETEQMRVWTETSRGKSEITENFFPADWNAAAASAPDATDILGIKLGMQAQQFEEIATERFPSALRYVSVKEMGEQGIFDMAEAFVNPENSETLLAITAETDLGNEVVAVMRYLSFAQNEVTLDGIRAALEKKYGQPALVGGEGRELYWGIPSRELDGWGTCGGHRTFRGDSTPQMEPDGADGFAPIGPLAGARALHVYGWPSNDKNEPFYSQALPYCGPTIAAKVFEFSGRVEMTTWLVDKKYAADAEARMVESRASEPLELDL